MTRHFLLILFLISLAPFSVFAQEAQKEGTSIRPDVLEMSELAERRIRQSVVDLLGPESRAVVNVYIRSNFSVPTLSVKDVLRPKSLLLSDYLPPAPSDPEELLEKGSIQISGAEVSIRVEQYVDATLRQEVEDIAKNILKGVNTSVSVEASLQEPVAQANRNSADRAPASVVEDTSFEGLLKRFSGLIPLLVGLLVFAGFITISSSVKNSAREIGEGLRSIKPASNSSTGGTLTLSAPELKALPQGDSASSENRRVLPPSTPVSNVEVKRNLEFIEKYIFDTPLLFARSIENDPEDLLGLKFLVAKVSSEAKTKLREIVGIEKILRATSYSLEQEIVGFNAGGWIQRLIERIEMKKLAGGSVVEESLSNEDSLLLSSAPQERLFEVARKINSPEGWRVAADFLSSDYLKKRSKDIDPVTWKNLVRGSLISEEGPVRQAAQSIISEIGISVSENAVMAKKQRESHDLFVNRILPSLSDSIYSMDFGEDDLFVNEILEEAPEYAASMAQFVWTPSKFDLFEDSVLSQLFERLDNERKSYLLVILPAKHAKRFESFLPDGNAKKIVLDYAAKLRASSDAKRKDTMRAFAREFLDYLRNQVKVGALALKEGTLSGVAAHTSASMSNSPADAEIVDDDGDESERKAS
ncbi:hypothetical protein GW916_10505 [bacterium]|nr:hypothetical protein [bacterium]